MGEAQDFVKAVELARNAPVKTGRVDYLVNRPREGIHVREARLIFDREWGIIGDRWRETAWMRLPSGAPDPRVQVSLTNTRVMQCFSGTGHDAVFNCGDNIYVDFNLTEQALPVGSRFRVGTALLEVSDVVNDACGKFAQRFGVDAFRFIRAAENGPLRLRGIFCSIAEPGEVYLGDLISLDEG